MTLSPRTRMRLWMAALDAAYYVAGHESRLYSWALDKAYDAALENEKEPAAAQDARPAVAVPRDAEHSVGDSAAAGASKGAV